MSTSDWDKVTILRKPKTSAKEAKSEATINRALASGAPVDTIKKMNAGQNKHIEGSVKVSVSKEDPDAFKIETVSLEVGRAIQKARSELRLSQKDLATKANEKTAVINEIEAGKAPVNNTVLGKLERILHVKLRGSAGIGTKLEIKHAPK